MKRIFLDQNVAIFITILFFLLSLFRIFYVAYDRGRFIGVPLVGLLPQCPTIRQKLDSLSRIFFENFPDEKFISIELLKEKGLISKILYCPKGGHLNYGSIAEGQARGYYYRGPWFCTICTPVEFELRKRSDEAAKLNNNFSSRVINGIKKMEFKDVFSFQTIK